MKGDRFRMTAQLLSERLPQLQGSGKAPFGVIGPSSPVVVADVTAQWVLHGAFTMGLKGLARLKAVLAACAALGAGMSAEQKAARFGLDELVVCLTPALVFDAAVASKWRAPQATDVIGGIVFLPNSLCRTDMTQKKNGVTTTATFNHLTSLMQALPVGVRGRVLVQNAVPMVSGTGTMNVAETCWDPVSRETLNFIAMTRVPWIVAASTDVQALFMRLCTQFGASITTPVGVEIRTMRHGDHTFEMYSVPHPCIVYTLADMYGAIVTATQRSASPPPPVLWNGAVPASLGNAGRVHPLASLKLITGCSAVAAKRRHWIGISVDTVQHLFQLRDGTITSNSRAIGDHSLKRSGVSAQPTQQHVPLTKDHKFLIVACDGLWDVMTDSEAVNLVAGMKDASKMADKLVKTAMQRGTTDNVSAMCIRLQQDDGARK